MANKLRVVLCGCGGISNAWFGPAKELPEIEFVGLVDINLANAEKRRAEHNLTNARVGTDLAQMLKDLKPDAVFDCTIPEVHCPVTLTALEHGCHVLGEKPLADSMEHARRMVAAAQAAGKIYAVIQNRRYMNGIRTLRQFLDTGALGRLTTLNCDFYIGAHFGGFRDKMKHVLLLDMAIHTFDAARMISAADPMAVWCHEWNPPGSWYDHDASAIAIFEMSNSLVYTYRGSWCAEGANTSWECDWRIIGDKGSVTWNGGDKFTCQVVEEATGFFTKKKEITITQKDFGIKNGGHRAILYEFVHAVMYGGVPETICTDNIKSLAMVFGAIESAEKGQKVTITI